MASTYSTNLKLQLMATGENTGTWGTVTNTNLGTALEEAIVGSVDVTFSSADVTLSLTNTNSNQTARNMRLVLVGVSGGARQLVVPAIEKIYIVKNELADTCTVKVSGQTGVAVPAGKTMWLCNDGTDVKDVVTHLSSLTLNSPLPVGSGGTGATSLNGLTFTGENITNLNASNISSGTIANARTTASSSNGASTIVSRGASGEFSAGVITADGSGLTALNASNISTGTVAVSRGGTGAGDAATARANLGAGTVTSVGGTGTVNGISLSGTVTGSGSLTLGGSLSGVSLTSQVTGTLPVGNGGTGAATLASNNVLLGNGTSALQTVAPGSSGNVLTSNGTTWASTALPTGITTTTGSPAYYGVRAFVNFNASSGSPVIRNSQNVSSITDNGVGDFTINLTTAMPDTNFTCASNTAVDPASFNAVQLVRNSDCTAFPVTTSTLRFCTGSSGGSTVNDPLWNQIIVIR